MVITMDQDEYSVPEAAEALGVSPSTVWRWINAKKLPAFRVGARKIKIDRDDLAAMITPARAEATGDPKPLEPIMHGPRTPEEWRRQREVIAEILDNQEQWSIAPLTTADLIRQVREEREERYASW